ncbi:MAG: cell division protein FtsZ [Rikenellaceae bacterium]
MDVNFKVPQIAGSIIMVAGVGGGGGSAVKHLYNLGVTDVAFMVINTDRQALERNPIPMKIQLGDGLGAGNKPEKAKKAAEESEDEIREALRVNDTKMLFITAGMGGGTGTGASPVVARIAKDMGILTVGIVSIPYKGEGPKRVRQAVKGIEELVPCVDSLIVINNEHIAQIYGRLSIREAHSKADDILAMGAKSIADIITSNMDVNVDFADVVTIMRDEENTHTDAKIALMGSATGSAIANEEDGAESPALRVAREAINSPLLHHNDIRGARKALLNITWGNIAVSYEESTQVLDFIQQHSGLNNDPDSNETDVIWGAGEDPSLGDNIRITIVATGYDTSNIPAISQYFDSKLTGDRSVAAERRVQREIIAIDDADNLSTSAKQPAFNDDEFVVRGTDGNSSHHSSSSVSSYNNNIQPTRIESIVKPKPVAVVETPAAEPVVVVPPSNSSAFVASEQMSSLVQDGSDSLDKPAYLRRGFTFDDSHKSQDFVRESLDGATRHNSHSGRDERTSTLDLFEQE